jgi:very-short-patch-repair endonuclease
MPLEHPVLGQSLDPSRLQAAKELRHNPTEAEQILWQMLRGNRLERWHFRRQQIIGPYTVDFYCHAARLIIEVDGEIHNQQVEYDQERTINLVNMGFRVIRFTNTEVIEKIDEVLGEIGRNLTPNPLPRRGKGARKMDQWS